MQLVDQYQSFSGQVQFYKHDSDLQNCSMNFSVYRPEKPTGSVLFWLSGLTCNEHNFMQKSGAEEISSQLGITIVCPDTSPRGDEIPDDAAYDLGVGAGFYLDATQPPWKKHFQMYSYLKCEFFPTIMQKFSLDSQHKGIFGHSMGGHGALTLGLSDHSFTSISAFAPITNPMKTPWGQKAFSHYLGENQDLWKKYDASTLIGKNSKIPILIDQGLKDQFLEKQLNPDAFLQAGINSNIEYRQHPEFDHSYYFIKSFMKDHLHFHHKIWTQDL